eukprot:9485729-Pyramimonas_sp.AAC.1
MYTPPCFRSNSHRCGHADPCGHTRFRTQAKFSGLFQASRTLRTHADTMCNVHMSAFVCHSQRGGGHADIRGHYV